MKRLDEATVSVGVGPGGATAPFPMVRRKPPVPVEVANLLGWDKDDEEERPKGESQVYRRYVDLTEWALDAKRGGVVR